MHDDGYAGSVFMDTITSESWAVATGSNGVGKLIPSGSSDGLPKVNVGMAITVGGEECSDLVAKKDVKCTDNSAGKACCEETLNSPH